MKLTLLLALYSILTSLAPKVGCQEAPQFVAGISVTEYSAEVRRTLGEFYARFDTARVMLSEANKEFNDLFKVDKVASKILDQLLKKEKVSVSNAVELERYKDKWGPKLKDWLKAQLTTLRRIQQLVDKDELLSKFQENMKECQKAIDDWEKKTDAASSAEN